MKAVLPASANLSKKTRRISVRLYFDLLTGFLCHSSLESLHFAQKMSLGKERTIFFTGPLSVQNRTNLLRVVIGTS